MTISSTDKKILIISDIHNNVDKLDKIIKAESADINLVLGDWFDSFEYDETHHYAKTAEYLMGYLSCPNNHTLFGNHDLHYFFYNFFLRKLIGHHSALASAFFQPPTAGSPSPHRWSAIGSFSARQWTGWT